VVSVYHQKKIVSTCKSINIVFTSSDNCKLKNFINDDVSFHEFMKA
jgi:hypothetical protein